MAQKTAAALHVFSSHGSGARSGSRFSLLIGGGNNLDLAARV